MNFHGFLIILSVILIENAAGSQCLSYQHCRKMNLFRPNPLSNVFSFIAEQKEDKFLINTLVAEMFPEVINVF